jgi:hypothetical protein
MLVWRHDDIIVWQEVQTLTHGSWMNPKNDPQPKILFGEMAHAASVWWFRAGIG